ncbi:MAG: immunoglobulin domain-containing protein, partial [Verrucomicrobiota bacterium]
MNSLFRVFVWIPSFLLILISACCLAAPPNDRFADAILLETPDYSPTSIALEGDTTGATLDEGETNNGTLAEFGAGGTLWWKWTAPEIADVQLALTNTHLETLVGVFTGENVSRLTTAVAPAPAQAACEESFCWHAGQVEFRAAKGQTYYFAVMPYPGSPRSIGVFAGTFQYLPFNDQQRISLTGESVRVNGNNYGATTEPGEPDINGRSMWYSWTAPAAGVLRARVSSLAFIPCVRAFRGDRVDALTVLAASGFDSGNIYVSANERIEIAVTSGCTWNGGVWGPYTLAVDFRVPRPASANDAFASAFPIEPFPYLFEGNLQGATREPREPTGPVPLVAPETLWWRFSASEVGVLTLAATAEDRPPILHAYRGTLLENLEWLTVSDGGILHLQSAPGETYWIQLSQSPVVGDVDEFTLRATFMAKPGSDDFSKSIPLEGLQQSVWTAFLDATIEPGEPIENPQTKQSLWWSWAAPADGRVWLNPATVLRNGTYSSAMISLWNGPVVDRLLRVPFRQEVSGGPILFGVKAGVIYHFQAWTTTTGFEPTGFQFTFTPFGPLENDHFHQAIPLNSLRGSSLQSIIGATREINEPVHRSGTSNKSLWWRWHAPINCSAANVINGFGTLNNVTLAVYQGSSVDTLRLVGKGTDVVFFETNATEPYYIAAEVPSRFDGDIEIKIFPAGSIPSSRAIAGNLVKNPSFEMFTDAGFTDWSGGSGGHINESAPDGVNFAFFNGSMWQDIPTIPGEPYRLRFSYANEQGFDTIMSVRFGGKEVGLIRLPSYAAGWDVAELMLTATENISRLEFIGAGFLISVDQVSLVWMNQPPLILKHPAKATAYAGASVSFHAGITGAEPIWRQWLFNGEPIPGANEASLKVERAKAEDAGNYSVLATNRFGKATSAPAVLTVLSPASPEIVLQPQGDYVFAGQYVALHVVAVGTPPLRYQWFKEGQPIAGA